jgi:hypothetical protein
MPTKENLLPGKADVAVLISILPSIASLAGKGEQ